MKKRRICIIYTGGTIGMVPSERGYIPSSGAFRRLLRAIPDLYWDAMPEWDVVEFDPLLDSSDVAVREWNQMGRAIADRYEEYDGFVILHGTDTMAYSASALAFMLENLAKPVIFTGAQIPLGQIRTDGRDNIINSMLIAASGRVHEVCIYFNGLLLRGCRSVKRSSDQFEAFAAPNDTPLAFAGIQIQYKRSALRPVPGGRVPLPAAQRAADRRGQGLSGHPVRAFRVADDREAARRCARDVRRGEHPRAAQNALLPIIERAYQNGTIIVVCSQCSQGTVSLGTYASSAALHEVGAVNGHDMTTEAAFAKLYYLLSRSDDPEWVKGQLGRDLRGELTE